MGRSTSAPHRATGACSGCGVTVSAARSRGGRQTRNYGNRAELAAARKYGGAKVGHHGGPVDIRGADWQTQMKTHRRLPPREWTAAFAAMPPGQLPRLLVRFVPVPGGRPVDFFVVPGEAWLDWFGRDE